jgi:hypothetical protein
MIIADDYVYVASTVMIVHDWEITIDDDDDDDNEDWWL